MPYALKLCLVTFSQLNIQKSIHPAWSHRGGACKACIRLQLQSDAVCYRLHPTATYRLDRLRRSLSSLLIFQNRPLESG